MYSEMVMYICCWCSVFSVNWYNPLWKKLFSYIKNLKHVHSPWTNNSMSKQLYRRKNNVWRCTIMYIKVLYIIVIARTWNNLNVNNKMYQMNYVYMIKLYMYLWIKMNICIIYKYITWIYILIYVTCMSQLYK